MDRGVVLTEVGRFGVVDVVVDEPGPGEVAVRIEATGVCHSDLHVIETGLGQGLPVLLGHEGAGVVEAVGEGVEHVAPGDRVVLGWRSPCGECRWCERGARQLCRTPAAGAARVRTVDGTVLTGVFGLGTFVTRTVVRGGGCRPVPQELPVEEACLLGCAIATGVGSVLKTAQVWEGARVGVIGCGAVGLSVVQGARIAGAAEIHAVDLDPRKLEAAELFGATHTGPGREARLRLRRRRAARDGGTGARHARARRHARLHRPAPAGSAAELPLQRVFDRRMRILVSHGGDHVPSDDFPMLPARAGRGSSTWPGW